MEIKAFTMQLIPGNEVEYKKRHDEIWPELSKALKEAGIHDYSIFLEESSGKLFAVLKLEADNKADQLPHLDIMQKWWTYMADIMETHSNNEPVVTDLVPVFHML